MPSGEERVAKGQLPALTPDVDFWRILLEKVDIAAVLKS